MHGYSIVFNSEIHSFVDVQGFAIELSAFRVRHTNFMFVTSMKIILNSSRRH